eukprot:TRINITY_DN10751_c0_g1_i1.p1 TRINITY_DN10751_c0_g1~~TRINITY_DN10751_c0_g1_i1.p1  ORF type:complete len:404 (+),score=50.87 TRINITY_DN10751_c0_g1_i1:137-1213(+)
MQHLKNDPLFSKLRRQNGFVNVYHVNDCAVKPWTSRSPCSVALLLNPRGVVPTFMVSHAWGEDIEELEDALDACFLERNIRVEEEFSIWICFLALYQPSADQNGTHLGPTIRAQIDQQPFESVIGLRHLGAPLTMIAAHTTREDIYRRLWCPKELFQAIDEQVEVWMAPSPAYRQSLLRTFEYWRQMASSDDEALNLWSASGARGTAVSLAVDTQAARCSCVEDERRIRGEIEASDGGYTHLDAVVLSLRKRETLACASRSRIPQRSLNPSIVVSLLKAAGFSAGSLNESGYRASQLKSAGFLLHDLIAAGFTADELMSAGYTVGDFESEQSTLCEILSAQNSRHSTFWRQLFTLRTR